MKTITLPAWVYQQFDADYNLPVPGEGYGGWKQIEVSLPLERTALISMHAWGGSKMGQFPGWDRCVEYRPRSFAIMEKVFPPLFQAARRGGLNLIHVVGGGSYFHRCAGYKKTLALMPKTPQPPTGGGAPPDPVIDDLRTLKGRISFVGERNVPDVTDGFKTVDFGHGAEPREGEFIAEDAEQLNAVCRHLGISHLIYVGFAINWCLLMSPGGMMDMSRRGYFCSAIRQAVTAVENRESARLETHKEEALWRTALSFGLVFDLDPMLKALS